MRLDKTLVFVCLVAVTLSASADANRKRKPTPEELPQLPPYCQDRYSGNSERMAHWTKLYGRETTVHLHHHCHGLLFYYRAQFTFDPKARDRLLRDAVKQSDYVLKRWKPESKLYPEALANKTRAQRMLEW